ncbi:MAG: hypothetical protein FJ291_34375 [Planctomycetes bacterium]|nr:hypothetical protein [Planctomycetota bacterium]
MSSRCLLAGCVLWLGLSVEADVLKLSTGGELRGTVQLVTFLVKDVQTIYPRDELVSVELGKGGADVLDSRSEEKQEGKVVSVMFEAADGLRSVARDKIAAITLDSATTLDTLKTQQKTEADAKEEEKSQLTKEQKESLLSNRALYQAYREAAETSKSDGYAAVKTRYNDRVRDVVRDLQRLERSIQNKILRREQASTTTRSQSGSSTYSQMSERERLERTDNLAQDQRDYERAKSTASKLKTTIRDEEKKVKEKFDQRLSRLDASYAGNRAKVFEGKTLTEDELTASYDAAIRLPGEKPFKMPKAPKPTIPTAPRPAKSSTDPKADTKADTKTGKVQQSLGDLKGE